MPIEKRSGLSTSFLFEYTPAAASTGDDATAMADIKKDVMAKTAKK